MGNKFKGFSTTHTSKPPFDTVGIECIKIDLMNEFNTNKGERAMMPNYGSIIQSIIHDPLDQISKNELMGDVERIIAGDPRVDLIRRPTITELSSSIKIDLELKFIDTETPEKLIVEFTRNLKD